MIECGIVEDINDPHELGRVRVRVFGLHSHNITDIPTEDLPWASVMQPTTSAANSGIGMTPRLLAGSMVIVMFMDEHKQFPMIIGSLPAELSKVFMNVEGTDVERGNKDYGFQDPTNQYPRSTSIGENDISRLAKSSTFAKHPAYFQRVNAKNQFGIKETANVPDLTTILESKKDDKYYNSSTFEEPHPMGGAEVFPVYPNNQVKETTSGMVEEYDDGNKRRHSYHPSGTYEEIVADGSRTLKITGLGTDIYLQGRNLHIDGDWNIVVTGNKRELIQGDYVLEVEGNHFVETKQDKHEKVGMNSYQEIGANQVENIGGNRTTNVVQNETLNVGLDRMTSIGEDEIRSVKVTEDVTIGDNATHRYSKNLKETVSEKSTRLTVGDSSYITGGVAYYSQNNMIFRTKEEESWTVNNGSRVTTIGTDDTLTVSGAQTYSITGNQDITASITNINNNVNVTGTITASSDISTTGGDVSTSSITLDTHVHSQPDTGPDATTQGDTGVGK